jgi:fibronectin type 3 domain-containing protein
MKKCVVGLSLIICTGILHAQKAKKEGIRVLADGKGDSIVLRWAPSAPVVWQMGNKYGYIVEKFTIHEDGKPIPDGNKKGKILTLSPLTPASKVSFDALEKTDERAAIVREAIYGDEFRLEASASGTTGILQKSQEMESRFGFSLLMCDLSPACAKAAGLSFVDKDIKPGSRYIYRIKLANTFPGFGYEPGIVLLDGNEAFKLNHINDLSVKFSDQTALLKWSIFMNNGIYSAYVIEKSEDGQAYRKISDQPLVNTTEKENQEYAYYIDSLADNTKKYYYRIRGISPFGEAGPGSNIVSGNGKDEITLLAIVDSAKVITNEKVKISWHIDNPENQPVKGFYVLKAPKEDGPYAELNPKMLGKNIFSYVDPSPGRSNYYRVKAIIDNDEMTLSYPYLALLVDSMPPARPASLAGTIDSTGIVRIKWEGNKEDDMLGYRVFRSNALHEEFVEVTTNILVRPSFKDTVTINTLTPKVYYKVIAVDKNFNSSDYSLPYELKRPDTIAPVKPVFAQIRRIDTTVRITWVSGHGADLASHALYRTAKATGNRQRLVEWASRETKENYIDHGLAEGDTYIYELEALDSSGNRAMARSGDIFYETGIRKPIQDIDAKAEREKRLISINWKYSEKGIRKIIVYRSKQGEPVTIYQTLEENTGKFEDKDLFINNTYVYKIQAVFTGGARSPISKEMIVKY